MRLHLGRMLTVVITGSVAGMAVTSCAPAPIYRPIKGADVDPGAGSLEAVRRQLQGTWSLVAYEVYEGSKPHRLPAQGEMSYDEFGNMKAHGELRRAPTGGSAQPMLLNYSGRAVIDPDTHQLRLLDVESQPEPLPSSIADAVNTANVRRFDLKGNSLTLTILAADGTPTAASSWKKTAQ
jgi:hypothetical protein